MNKYITTAIFYANSKLHIGSAYEVIYADTIANYARMNKFNTFFLTGMDEHGQKIQNSAIERNLEPQVHVDEISMEAKSLFDELKISYDYFIRTSDVRHKEIVQIIFDRLLKQGDIYLDAYEGNYCMHCEAFFTQNQLINGSNCPQCNRPTQLLSEESYFLNLKKYEQQLIEYINNHENFIIPDTRRNEVLSFLSSGLENLSVTRTSFDWGIPTLNDPKHVIYVWIDALSNYISALGYPNDELFNKFWNNGHVTHIIGKDILRFHAIYWPIVLMALNTKLPDSIVVHGFIMMGDDKMSKSKGNVVYPLDYTRKYGIDPLRYYLLTELANGNDGNFTTKLFLERFNTELVNDLSNLVNRTASMNVKYFNDDEIFYTNGIQNQYEIELTDKLHEVFIEFNNAMNNYDTKKAIHHIWTFIARTNKFIDETTPWVLVKEDTVKLRNVLYILTESIRNISTLIKIFIPDTSLKIYKQFNLKSEDSYDNIKFNFDYKFITNKPEIIYNRIDIENELKEPVEEFLNEISIDEFSKMDLRVAKIIDCYKHPKADKLLIFKLQVGNSTRQIVSGIANWYKPEELVNKNVVIIANLKPVKLRGEISEGMILSAEKDGKLCVLESNLEHNAIVK